MNKRKSILLVIIAIIIAVVVASVIYLTYIADYTYKDERISVTVPAQTKFNITANNNEAWTFVRYNSSDENNITIDLMKLKQSDVTIFGINLDLFETSKNVITKDLTQNKSYKVVTVTENYTIYYNKEKNRYAALLFDKDKRIITMICCDSSSELMNKLANSFELKSFTTEGLDIVNIDNNTDTNNSIPTTEATVNNSKEKPMSEWDKDDYIAHGYGSDVSDPGYYDNYYDDYDSDEYYDDDEY